MSEINIKSKYKLVAIDIDGTTVDSKGDLSSRNIEVIRKVVDAGIPVCIVTGRNIYNAQKIARKLNTKTPVVCCDGATMFDPVENKIVYEKYFPQKQLKEVLDILNKHHVYVEMSSANHYYQFIKSKELGKYNYGGSPNTFSGKLKRMIKHNVRYIRKIDRFLGTKPIINQVIFIGEAENVQKAKEEIISKKYDNVELRDNLWNNFVFIVQKDCKKSDGVKLLCNKYGINMEDTIAIGDELNDIDMIENAGLGIAVGNANQRIKDVAKYITLTNDEDGVAHALEKFILNGEEI